MKNWICTREFSEVELIFLFKKELDEAVKSGCCVEKSCKRMVMFAMKCDVMSVMMKHGHYQVNWMRLKIMIIKDFGI